MPIELLSIVGEKKIVVDRLVVLSSRRCVAKDESATFAERLEMVRWKPRTTGDFTSSGIVLIIGVDGRWRNHQQNNSQRTDDEEKTTCHCSGVVRTNFRCAIVINERVVFSLCLSCFSLLLLSFSLSRSTNEQDKRTEGERETPERK